MSRKSPHRNAKVQPKVFKQTDYTQSKHTQNEYKKFLIKATHEEMLKEYNKLSLLMNMMKVGNNRGMNPYTKGQDNIKVIKYKYNLLCQEINRRNYKIMNKNYNQNIMKSKYKSL